MATIGMDAFCGSGRARICRAASMPSMRGICKSIKIKSYVPAGALLTFSTATAPSSAVSTVASHISKSVTAISRLTALSSVSRMRNPAKLSPPVAALWRSFRMVCAKICSSSTTSTRWSDCNGNSTLTINSAPLPSSVMTRMPPPIISTNLLAMDSPSPAPETPLCVVFRSRSNGSKARAANSALMPIPVSLTLISYAP